MKQLILTILFSLSTMLCFADGGFSFFAGDYYFYIDYGLEYDKTTKTHNYKYLHETYLDGTKIWHLEYDKVTRRAKDDKSVSIEAYTQTAKLKYSDDKKYIVASIGEHVFILTPDFEIFRAYRNTHFKKWMSDKEILVVSEDGNDGSKYGTSDYIINLKENSGRKADK
ncbi:MAG: hypothetical protein A2W97_13720 [Bacteroidetes bacterium GWE2_40_63]|nr:MAG: hypothetical protein A2W84_12205 [Bacteroidetes bacterium GWC2_40_13]OFX73783.1 MAG: hypothetical protein A2W96_07900 [Bacteroidetes bacterium GWD2_40_43]OFX89411.1 MAG: hypothetical protein A2W97_13720 [Bacteroidetes bacterium GWE2_40_63]OFY20743.1 MAG: hypothetical protein A2W88_05445 [Bacteroidetes bacterium GWF2_40_13]HBX83698.1 hypothetical protein [Marinilabiliales bacterium]